MKSGRGDILSRECDVEKLIECGQRQLQHVECLHALKQFGQLRCHYIVVYDLCNFSCVFLVGIKLCRLMCIFIASHATLVTPVLDEFISSWISLFSHRLITPLAWQTCTGGQFELIAKLGSGLNLMEMLW